MNGVELRVKGKVQGVGFRPYVWKLAHEMALKGEVLNDGEGVLIRLLADTSDIQKFQTQLRENLPPLAQVDSQTSCDFQWETEPTSFSITQSESTAMDTQVVPDAATCPECLEELYNSVDPRYHYPFINCTHCGPRFTIINALPYDRPKTVMADFPLCSQCQSEYSDPADRRYHAQPVACPECGPKVWLSSPSGKVIEGDWLTASTNALAAGKILAIKSVGGFHLACDATNAAAVQNLRNKKHRQSKPFAVMLHDHASVEKYAWCNEYERKALSSRIAPIVLLKRKEHSEIAENIAPKLSEIGMMLPSNPLQHLLSTAFNKPIVMTSGNATGLPPALNNEEALETLGNVADLFVLHNRGIVQRCDDSLIRIDKNGKQQTLRRSRGYVPDAVNLPEGFPNADGFMAYGGDLKNAFAIGKGKQIIVSQYLGDLSNIETQNQYKQAIDHFEKLYQVKIKHHVTDLHPGYFSHQYARTRSEMITEIQHHHAHIAACLMEHAWKPEQGQVIALAFDGLGMGDDGSFWGAELMLADYSEYKLIGGLPSITLQGGDQAAKQPWRSLHAHLKQSNLQNSLSDTYFADKPVALINKAIESKINTHSSRSAGRFFDAVAASLGIEFDRIEYEGQAACQLEALASSFSGEVEEPVLQISSQDLKLDLSTFWKEWLALDCSNAEKAYLFHLAFAKALSEIVIKAKEHYGIATLVLTGGVFHNALLTRLLKKELSGQIDILEHELFSCGDGSLALGQLAIALYQQSYPRPGKNNQ